MIIDTKRFSFSHVADFLACEIAVFLHTIFPVILNVVASSNHMSNVVPVVSCLTRFAQQTRGYRSSK